MAKQISIGTTEFPTKKSAEEFIRGIVQQYSDGETITDPHHSFVCNLLLLYPEAEQKIGSGIDRFTIERDSVFHAIRHFVVVRVDGTKTDFSWPSCLDGKNV